ncbi:putative COP9 signalosome complex subunit 2 [Tilletiaria anomala UBC 951]|uniref:COP9 signalosome complex subunit 2 n=1 Tax=Tilletiaria anomala (strain ATCC 24038 / CBS 436.72 / UBC 951) TaxID=1037660 RepID=A0A066W052_TILAU|nr:putative COP9 signalosome complex subunit 2 [Tilletiaria anomala UBC 951]KDN45898.1 putative COP9 signalosome complex subunit 2 [Tilletiaria anomala UBC 951]
MSDDEFMMDDGADEEYDFEFEEDDEGDEEHADIENLYYNAKALKEDNPNEALRVFRSVVDKEETKGDWGFKALKQITKAHFRTGSYEEALKTYTELLGYTKSAVTRNYSEKSINNILDYVSNSNALDLSTMERFYSVTVSALEEARNERLSVKTDLKLARLWLARQEWPRLEKTIKGLKEYCLGAEGEGVGSDQSKGTILMEVFATEIQMYGEMGHFKRLKEVYNATLQVKNAIPHPRIMGIIRECGGKMHMSEKNWTAAQQDFFQAFNSYDEAGSPQRIQVLKYLVLAVMLMGSDINPFDSQETKPYKNDPEIVAMTDLVSAYQRREVHEAEKILENQRTIMEDNFIKGYIDELLNTLRTQYLMDIIKPYNRLDLRFLAKQLNTTTFAVESLLRSLILEGRISGKIDQVNQKLELDRSARHINTKRYAALASWLASIDTVSGSITSKAARGYGGGDVLQAESRSGMMEFG